MITQKNDNSFIMMMKNVPFHIITHLINLTEEKKNERNKLVIYLKLRVCNLFINQKKKTIWKEKYIFIN